MPKDPLRPLVEALRPALAAAGGAPAFRQAWGDLRETCGPALGPKEDLATLVARYVAADLREGVVAAAMERVLSMIPDFERETHLHAHKAIPETPDRVIDAIYTGIDALLDEHFGKSVTTPGVRILDPRAGTGSLIAGIAGRLKPGGLFANEARLEAYLLAAKRLEPFEGLCFADSLALPKPSPTPGFDFDAQPNTERLRRQRDARIDVVVSDLRHARIRPYFEWADGRLEDGVAAFVTDGAWIDEPADAPTRAWLESAYGLIVHDSETGVTFFVRHPSLRPPARILYDGKELHPTPAHVWRTEILRGEWPGFMPLVGGKSLLRESFEGAESGPDAATPTPKARPVLRRPFVKAWRRPLKKGVPWPPEGLALVTMEKPFGVFVTTVPPDRKVGRIYPLRIGARENVSPWGLARLRAAYGPGITERDAFDYAVALLHHPGYQERYHEDLRRGLPRIPLLDLESLLDLEGPPVGPGTAFGTGWTPPGFYEEGTVPEYDDPFASPYARADVQPGFLLFAGLGAALTHVQTFWERIRSEPLERIATGGSPRITKDRIGVVVGPNLSLTGIPRAAFDYRVGRRSALEWLVEGMKGIEIDVEDAARRVEQVVAVSLEANRMLEIVGSVPLSTDVR